MARVNLDREASPTAGIIDSQSVKTVEGGGPRGYATGWKIKGRKRHILTDTQGLTVGVVIPSADIQDPGAMGIAPRAATGFCVTN